MVRRGDTLVLPAGTRVWWTRSDEEIRSLRDSDIAAGRFCDSAGESIVYSPLSSFFLDEDVVVLVTRLRGIVWPGWTRRPAVLTEGFLTLGGIPRYVLFRREKT